MHAAGESAALYGGPLPEDTHAVVLGVADERELLLTAARLERRGIRHILIREPDFPSPDHPGGAATAIGVVPGPREAPRRALAHLKLL